ncbi:MAG: replicative DNA helicase [Saprospiraceae bacterium]|jgi:replicative DNA helicase
MAKERYKTEKNDDLSQLMYGKVMPQATELEEAVLGAAMLDKGAFSVIVEKLRPDSFYLPSHQEIFDVMMQLFANSKPIDILTVHEELRKRGKLDEVGGVNYLMDLTNKVASAANIEYHAQIIIQKYIQRSLIEVSTRTIKDAYEDSKDVIEMMDEAEQGLYDITDQNLNTGYQSVSAVAARVAKNIEQLSTRSDALSGVTTGFGELDRMTNGWQESDLIIIAARPGMGKTAFTLSLANNAAAAGRGVAIFSLEMNDDQLVQRLISMTSMIQSSKLRDGNLDKEEFKLLHDAVEKLSEMPIYIDDTPAINIFELRAKCRRLKQNHDIGLVVIDYLQLMSAGDKTKRGNREQEISSISRALKGMAKELKVPVIALSQLSRAVETRGGDKRPQLSDLRESGAIEQDADIVTFIYRPEYYDLSDDMDMPDNMAEIIIAKHRNGSLGTVNLRFLKEYVKFVSDEGAGFRNMPGQTDIFSDGAGSFITRPSRINEEGDEDMYFDA